MAAPDEHDKRPEDESQIATMDGDPPLPPSPANGSRDPLIGRSIGRFQVVARLGKGGMGVVYRAHDADLRRDVALKILPREATEDSTKRARFLREARAAAGLTHAAIATIHDAGFDEKEQLAFIAMELVDGQDLRSVVTRGPMPVDDVRRLALQVARALSRAHASRIVHRDLKPENVMLTADGDAKVLDFGLAKDLGKTGTSDGATTIDGAVMGTPGYMAPEQVMGFAVDARADVFAFGVLVHEMLMGKAPFSGPTPLAAALAVTIDTPAPLSRADVTDELRAVVARCLQKDPAGRYADGGQIVEALVGHAATSGAVPVAAAAATGSVVTPMINPSAPAPAPAPPQPPTAELVVRALGRPRRRAAAVVGFGAIALVAVAMRVAHVGPFLTGPERLRAAWMDPTSEVACLPLTVTGDGGLVAGPLSQQPGVAAAAITCMSVGWERFAPERALGPAALLSLPVHGTSAVPEAPFEGEAARALSTAAGRRAITIGGTVHLTQQTTTVTLTASTNGTERLRVEQSAPDLYAATIAAIDALVGAIDAPPTLAPPEDQALLGAAPGPVWRLRLAVESAPTPSHCDTLAATSPLHAAGFAEVCRHPERDAQGWPAWPTGVGQQVAALSPVDQAYWSLKLLPPQPVEQVRGWAATLREARRVRSRLGAASLAVAEISAWSRLGDDVATRNAFDAALAAVPDACGAWNTITRIGGELPALRVATAWCPSAPALWSWRGMLSPAKEQIPYIQFAYLLAGRPAGSVLPLARALRDQREWDAIRALASFHLDRGGKYDQPIGTWLLAIWERGTRRPQAALDRVQKSLSSTETWDEATSVLATQAFQLGALLGRSGTGDALLERLVLAVPPRIEPGVGAGSLLEAIGAASPPVARRALAVVRRLSDEGILRRSTDDALALSAWQQVLDGDAAGAARTIRPRVGHSGLSNALFAGDPALLEQHHRAFVGPDTTPNLHHAELAVMLAARGDHTEARELAGRFVDAFSKSDAEVPMVATITPLLRVTP